MQIGVGEGTVAVAAEVGEGRDADDAMDNLAVALDFF